MNMRHVVLFGCCTLLVLSTAIASDLVNPVSDQGTYGDPDRVFVSGEYPAGSQKYYLWEGRFWAGAKVDGVYRVTQAGPTDYEWTPAGGGAPQLTLIGTNVLEHTVQFDDLTAGGTHVPIGFDVTQDVTAFSFMNEPQQAHLFELSIQNVSGAQLDSVYFAWVFDFDVCSGPGGDQTDSNIDDLTGWDDNRWLAYMYDGDNPNEPGDDTGDGGLSPGYPGIAWLDGTVPPAAFQWWDWNSDPTTDAERFQRISGNYGAQPFADPPTVVFDYRVMLSVGPYTMAAGATEHVAICFAIGDGLDGLQAATDDMIAWYNRPVTFEMFPQQTSIPPGGGTMLYGLSLESELNQTISGLSYWTVVEMPNGQTYGPIVNLPFTHTPMMSVSITNIPQTVSPFAPPGMYSYYGYIGFYPNWLLTDFVEFEKTGTIAGSQAFDPEGWRADVDVLSNSLPADKAAGLRVSGIADDKSAGLPQEFSMSNSWPNPFNSSTTVSITLPEQSELTVEVFNTAGQKVATLADGLVGAGDHALTFDAHNLASGIYVIRASAPGWRSRTNKVLLIR